MAKRVNVLKTFDYQWPNAQAVTHVSATGVMALKDDLADWAISKGYAVEIEEPKRTTPPTRNAIRRRGQASNARGTAGVDPADFPDARRAAHGRAMDPDAE